MDEIIPGLWIGDLSSALDVERLRENNIYSILTAMRGRITINETFIRHQILLDDTANEDILVHLLPSIHFIQAELDKGRGVLVHCQAGISRSATIVAAYIMYSRNIDTETAFELIRCARPNVEPNEGFLLQLEIFHKAQFKISRRDKTTRMFYMERAVDEVMNGDGSLPETSMFARFPPTPSDSAPATPGGPRRRIRCKMCRQELATREHMLDHGQLGPSTPAMATPATSRRPSSTQTASRRPSMTQFRPRVGSTDTRSRRPSGLSYNTLSGSLAMSTIGAESGVDHNVETATMREPSTLSASSTLLTQAPVQRDSGSNPVQKPSVRSLPQILRGPGDPSSSMSALDSGDDIDESEPITYTEGERETASPAEINNTMTSNISIEAARQLGRRLSDAVLALRSANVDQERAEKSDVPTTYLGPADLVAQLHTNPKLAALRSPLPLSTTPINMTPLQSPTGISPFSPPILANAKCSGYFVEPMKWMEPFLESGQLAGKIVCPNKKCGAKLGNYDWAGVCCGCKEWVTPGFCINRSKVDEVV